jgi:hypothetical protein
MQIAESSTIDFVKDFGPVGCRSSSLCVQLNPIKDEHSTQCKEKT